MAKRTFKAGATSQTIDIFVQDSSSTTGAGLSGLAYNTSGLKAYYRLGATGTPTSITLATQTVGGAYSSGGFVEVDATNMKGVYRFDVPNAVIATGPMVTLYFYGAANMAPVVAELELVAYDPYDTVRMGMTALPNVASGNSGAVITAGTGTAQLSTSSGQVLVQTGTGTGQLDFTSGVVKANVTQFGGSAGTFASGRPEVNTSHISGSAVSTSSAQIGVNVVNFGGSAGTFAAGRPEVNMTHISGSSVSTSAAQLGVNVVNLGGSSTPVTNLTTVYSTDFATNYDATNKVWKVNTVYFAGAAATLNSSNYPLVAVRYWRDSSVQTSLSLETIATVGAVSTSIGSGAISSTSFASGAITAAAIAADAIGASELASDAVSEIATAVWTDLLASSDFSTASSIGKLLKDDIDAKLSTIDTNAASAATSAGGAYTTLTTTIDTKLNNIGAKTINLPSSPAAVGSAMTLADSAVDAAKVTAAAANKIADHVLRRNQSNVEASSNGDTLAVGSTYGFIQQAQNSNTTDTPGTLAVKKTDDTSLGSLTVSSDAAAEPITGIE